MEFDSLISRSNSFNSDNSSESVTTRKLQEDAVFRTKEQDLPKDTQRQDSQPTLFKPDPIRWQDYVVQTPSTQDSVVQSQPKVELEPANPQQPTPQIEGAKIGTEQFLNTFRKNFEKLDANKNDYVDKDEIALLKKDIEFNKANPLFFGAVEKNYSSMMKLHNDECFSETKGVTLKDLDTLGSAYGSGFGLGQAFKHGFFENTGYKLFCSGVAAAATTLIFKGGFSSFLRSTGITFGAWSLLETGSYAFDTKPKLKDILEDLG